MFPPKATFGRTWREDSDHKGSVYGDLERFVEYDVLAIVVGFERDGYHM